MRSEPIARKRICLGFFGGWGGIWQRLTARQPFFMGAVVRGTVVTGVVVSGTVVMGAVVAALLASARALFFAEKDDFLIFLPPHVPYFPFSSE